MIRRPATRRPSARPAGSTWPTPYDGALLTGETWSGPVTGSVNRAYDNNFRVISTSVNGGQAVAFQYDKDNLLTQAGALTLTYHAQTGLLTGSVLGSVTDTIGYNGFAESLTYNAAYNGTSLYNGSTRPRQARAHHGHH